MKFPVFAMLFTFFLLPAVLFPGDINTITCEQAISMMRKNNLDVLQAEKDLSVAKIQLGQSYASLYMPNISGSGSFTFSGAEINQSGYQNTNIAGQNYVIANSYPDNYSAGLSVSKTLFNGLQLWNAKEIQKRNVDLAEWNYRNTLQTNQVATIQSFYNILLLRKTCNVSENTAKSLKNRLDYVSSLYRKGRTNELAYLQALVNYRNNSPKVILASNNYVSAKQSLCLLIGITNAARLDQTEFVGSLSDMTNGFTNGSALADLADNAVSNDSSLKSIDVELDTAVLNRTTADLSKLPSLSANFGYRFDYKRDNSYYGIRTWQPSWNAGLSLDIPVESWLPFSKEAQVSAQYNTTAEKLVLSRTQRVQNILAQLQNSLLELKRLQDTLDSQSDSVRLARRQLDLYREQYKRGDVSPLDLQDTEVSYEEADLAYWQAFYDYASAALAFRSMTRDGGKQP